MAVRSGNGRVNQRLRTRKDLLVAAARLLKEGHSPSMDEIAAAALVSRATAYRYFPTLESLLIEAPLQGEVPDPDALFAGDDESDAQRRIDKAEAILHQVTCGNLAQLRLMLASSLTRVDAGDRGVPRRQNRRTALIEAALAPVRDQLEPSAYRRLCRALAVYFGTEGMIVFADVLRVSDRTAREVKSWATRALVRAALQDAAIDRRT